MDIPQDPMILLSFVNTKLRDFYKSLDELCEDLETDKEYLIEELKAVGYEYDEKYNKFM